ncbi:hypothetical protein Vretimale_17618 [Volvox reticuliferus]|uniref:Cyclin C-terminal domain-containing protein n=3 Tax=Volvox reticuliferus TaxID=1737510 RepID=A0A8J4CWQ7_9CHLO|nr:hypothetical protein Vretifemale_18138 [Volvox reticuliferus]GIM14673.1 hypothetical protein Vretimale_17618 [Volvox reticuliferus]
MKVSQARQLDGAAVFLATRFMDVFLAFTPPVPVSLLQLVGISSLRTALRVLQDQKTKSSETKTNRTRQSPLMRALASTSASVVASVAVAVTVTAPLAPLACSCLDPTHSELRAPRPCLQRPSTWSSDQDSDFDCDVAGDAYAIVTTEISPSVRGGNGKATAMAPSSPPLSPPPPSSPSMLSVVVEPLSAATAVDLCADAYSVEDVERMTKCIGDLILLQLNGDGEPTRQGPWMAPTARHFFRSLWAVAAADAAPMAVLPPSFLMHVSLMCPSCSASPPSHVAAAALSLAMEALGQPPWPPALQRTLPLRLDEDLGPVRARIVAAQMKYDLPYMRGSWMEELSEARWSMDGKPLERPILAAEDTAAAASGGGSGGGLVGAGETIPSDRGAGGGVAGGPAGGGSGNGAASGGGDAVSRSVDGGGNGCGVASNVAAMRQIVEVIVQRKGALLPVAAVG